MRPRVLITDNDLGDSAMETAAMQEALDAEVFVRQYRSEEEVVAGVQELSPDALIVQWAPITAAVMDAMPGCKVISRLGIGVDMIDLDAARARDIVVHNVPTYCIEEVATHAFATALALWRSIPALDAQVRSGEWSAITFAPQMKRLSNATIGIVGMGRIGRTVAKGFQAWGSSIIVHDPVSTSAEFTYVDLDTLVAESDIISLHAPLTDETRHMINARTIDLMTKQPIIVNTSRGPLIDEAALVSGLASGKVGGAALDVFASEPLPLESELRSAPNVILTPHAAWASAQALPDLRRLAAQNIIDFLKES
jgi:D-3-phosphoglycerate dehydrogenase